LAAHPALMSEIENARDDAINLLRTLVRFPSITGSEAEIGAFVARYCRDIGLAVEIVEAEPGRPNIIATWNSGRPGPTLLLNDHLDIVPPGPLENWHYPPFDAVVADGLVHGRGTILAACQPRSVNDVSQSSIFSIGPKLLKSRSETNAG
jgi:acetylornithine deacetylase/succinyl-diaminopimelate desuccinylase-like protein